MNNLYGKAASEFVINAVQQNKRKNDDGERERERIAQIYTQKNTVKSYIKPIHTHTLKQQTANLCNCIECM